MQGAASSVAQRPDLPSWQETGQGGPADAGGAADSDDASRKRVLRSHTSGGGPSHPAFEVPSDLATAVLHGQQTVSMPDSSKFPYAFYHSVAILFRIQADIHDGKQHAHFEQSRWCAGRFAIPLKQNAAFGLQKPLGSHCETNS